MASIRELDPLYVSAAEFDFRLTAQSACIDAGASLFYDTNGPAPGLHNGPAPALGAWEAP